MGEILGAALPHDDVDGPFGRKFAASFLNPRAGPGAVRDPLLTPRRAPIIEAGGLKEVRPWTT